MPTEIFGIKILSILITVNLWYWNIRREHVTPIKHRNRVFSQNRFASIAFVIFLTLELLIPHESPQSVIYLTSFVSMLVFLVFATLTPQNEEGFWKKKRNKIIGILTFFILAAVIPQFISSAVIIPAIFSILIANICYLTNDQLFSDSLQDLDGVQNKLISLNAQLTTEKTMKNLTTRKAAKK